jgi:hypothetical protein
MSAFRFSTEGPEFFEGWHLLEVLGAETFETGNEKENRQFHYIFLVCALP